MSTQLSQILDRLDAVLLANASCPTSNLWRDRLDAQIRDEAPGINVLAHMVSREPLGFGVDKCEAEIELRISVRAADCTAQAESLHLSVHGPLMRDTPMKQLADTINLASEEFERHEADETSLIKGVRYRFTFSANRSEL